MQFYKISLFGIFPGLGIAVLAIGLVVRIIVSFCVVFGSGLTIKEQIFVALAWFPKATVQVSRSCLSAVKFTLHV